MQFKGIISSKSFPVQKTDRNDKMYKTTEITVKDKDNNEMVFTYFNNGDYMKYVDELYEKSIIGQEVIVEYSISITKYNEKLYNSVRLIKVTQVDESSNTTQEPPKQESNTNQSFNDDNEDDLPF